MNAQKKLEFIDSLMNDIRDTVKDKVFNMPEEWDGIELRWYIADKVREQSSAEHFAKSDRRRHRAYENTVITNNL